MKMNPYLSFNGQCAAAFKFYEKVFGGKVPFKMTYGESPMANDSPPETHKQIMHTRLIFGDNVLMGSDSPCNYAKPQGIRISLNVETPSEADRVFAALSEKATIEMPIQETFWAQRFGMLTDQFDIPWMINCEKSN